MSIHIYISKNWGYVLRNMRYAISIALLLLASSTYAQSSEAQPPSPQPTPLGARISDALTRQDREAAVDILEHDRVLMNDEMNLLLLAGRTDEAADIAFILMDRASLDESLYEQAAPILLANARVSGLMTTFNSYDSYNSLNTEISTSGHRIGRLKFDLSYYQETRDNVNIALLTGAPNESGGEISFHQFGDSYVNTLSFQSSQALNIQTGIRFNHHHQIGSRLKLETLLAYNQTANENAAMRIIGRSNHLAIEGIYSMDNSNQLIIGAVHHQYKTIDEQELGSGNFFTSTLSHELSGAHPALRSRITGTWNQFQTADQIIIGKTASLIPIGETNSASYFMPQDVSEIAAYISLGDAIESKLPARSFAYAAEIGIFDNPAIGPGWRASTGLAGRVMGADRLHMFIRYDQSPSGQGFSSLQAGIAYQLFY